VPGFRKRLDEGTAGPSPGMADSVRSVDLSQVQPGVPG
jgi:hypothetical protein